MWLCGTRIRISWEREFFEFEDSNDRIGAHGIEVGVYWVYTLYKINKTGRKSGVLCVTRISHTLKHKHNIPLLKKERDVISFVC